MLFHFYKRHKKRFYTNVRPISLLAVNVGLSIQPTVGHVAARNPPYFCDLSATKQVTNYPA